MQFINDPDNAGPLKSYLNFQGYKNHAFRFILNYFSLLFNLMEKIFCVAIQCACASRKTRGKTRRQIHYVSYYERALKITKIQLEVLYYICTLVPNNVTGEILKDWYKVLLNEFCKALQNKLLSVLEDLLEEVCCKYIFITKVALSN